MKEWIKNITNNRVFGFDAATLAYNEDGKKIILKPGEKMETKLKGKNISGRRLKIVNDKGEIYGRGTRLEKTAFKLEKILDDDEEIKKKKVKGDKNDS